MPIRLLCVCETSIRYVFHVGGVGILIGWLASLLLLATPPFEEISSPLSGSTIWLLVSAALACGLGFLDDQQNLRARYKLLGQLALGIFTAAVVFRPDTLTLPLIGLVEIGWFGGPLMVLWIVGVMNAINLVDGLDGLGRRIKSGHDSSIGCSMLVGG